MHELFLVMEGQVRWDYITIQIIHKIAKPWNQVLRSSQYMLIRKGVINLSLFTQLSHSFIL